MAAGFFGVSEGATVAVVNEYGQPVGERLGDWAAPPHPPAMALAGARVRLVPMAAEHADALAVAFAGAARSLWTYLPVEALTRVDDWSPLIADLTSRSDWLPFVIEVGGVVQGMASYLRIDPAGGVIEIGMIAFAPVLQRTAAATESMLLMIGHAFDLGYRRVEWKCDALNEPSRRAALRLGFSYEGTFRKATHYKGRNRDTAWYSMIDTEWPERRRRLLTWLDPANFDEDGRQISALSELVV